MGGVLGKKIAIMIEDDQHEPKQAVSIANKIVNAGAVGIIGHFNSSCSILRQMYITGQGFR